MSVGAFFWNEMCAGQNVLKHHLLFLTVLNKHRLHIFARRFPKSLDELSVKGPVQGALSSWNVSRDILVTVELSTNQLRSHQHMKSALTETKQWKTLVFEAAATSRSYDLATLREMSYSIVYFLFDWVLYRGL